MMAGVNKQRGMNILKTKENERQIMTRKALAVSNAKRVAEKSPDAIAKKRSVLGDLGNKLHGQAPIITKKVNLKGQEDKGALHHESKVNNKAKEAKKPEEPKWPFGSLKSIPAKKETKSLEHDENSAIFSDNDDSVENCMKIEEDATTNSSAKETSDSGDELLSSAETRYIAPDMPDGVEDFDKEMVDDPSAEPHYAADIFEYYREQEVIHKAVKYLDKQPEISKNMRSILVDWIVEVQESFELNHETMYLAVKIIDHYLMRKKVTKASLQLVGATSIFIASKFDERIPPILEDFVYICDDAYSRDEIIEMEQDILKTLDFYLGFPLSYRFLRRYARCSKLQMDTLTLARYILETSLMDYELIEERDSKVAAAALLLALKMKHVGSWDKTLEHYSGYTEQELLELTKHLNRLISQQSKSLQCVKTKYSHKVFFEVAKIPPLPLEESTGS